MRPGLTRAVRAVGVVVGVVASLVLAGCGGGGGQAPGEVLGTGSSVLTQALTPFDCPLASVPDRARVMAISASPRLDPYPTTTDAFLSVAQEAFQLVQDAGAHGQMSTFHWADLEPSAGVLDPEQWRNMDGEVCRAQGQAAQLFLGIQLINTSQREVPAEFASLAFDDPRFVEGFHALLDDLLTRYKGRLAYLSIGNEVDAYLRGHPAQWGAYQRFYADAVAHVHALDDQVKVGVTTTFDGALNQSPTEVKALNLPSDVLILTYYPLQFSAAGVQVRDPSVVAGDFQRMLTWAGARPLVLQEVGYPAASAVGSSDDMQAAFVSQVFAAWQAAGGRVPFLNVFLLHDFTPALCAQFNDYYGAAGVPGFSAFLCSLGLRKVDGSPRPAWSRLLTEAAQAQLP